MGRFSISLGSLADFDAIIGMDIITRGRSALPLA